MVGASCECVTYVLEHAHEYGVVINIRPWKQAVTV